MVQKLLDYFFTIHDPSTVDSQGNDKGSSYRSALFIQNEQERSDVGEIIMIVEASGRWPDKVVTILEPLTKLWPAEDYHQDYLITNPNGHICHFERFGTFL